VVTVTMVIVVVIVMMAIVAALVVMFTDRLGIILEIVLPVVTLVDDLNNEPITLSACRHCRICIGWGDAGDCRR
jgi:hypothetical protein